MELEAEVGWRGVDSTKKIKPDSHLTSERSHVPATQRGVGWAILVRLSDAAQRTRLRRVFFSKFSGRVYTETAISKIAPEKQQKHFYTKPKIVPIYTEMTNDVVPMPGLVRRCNLTTPKTKQREEESETCRVYRTR